MTPEEKQRRIEQIEAAQVKRRESLAFHRSEYPGLPSPDYIDEIDFLLSLVKSQEADSDGEFYMAACDYRNKECAAYGVTIGGKWICNNHICKQRQQCWLSSKEARGTAPARDVDAATSMRSACVEKVREYGKRHQLCHPLRARAATDLVEELESLSIEKPKE